MNNRIKELAEQSGMTDDKFGMFFAKDFESHCKDGVDLELFAKAIVMECATLCDPESGLKYSPNAKSSRSDCKEKILRHFGIS